MTTDERVIFSIYLGLIAIWPIRYVVVRLILRYTDRLTPASPRWSNPVEPLVTVVIPAKDEEASLRGCVESVLAQTYRNMEVLIVDDRSTDRTPEIARGLAAADSRVEVISIDSLPPGWTGKTHGLHVASHRARGEWYWFVDADTRHDPASLSVVMEYARSKNARLASLLPEMRCETFWERVVQPLAGIVLMQSFPLFRVNNDRDPTAFANGQYILIEREAYRSAGGHAEVRDRFVEDIHLARRVKRLGMPIRTAVARDLGSTRMYTSLSGLTRGWARILYDALDRNPIRLALKALDPLIFSQTAHIVFVASGLGLLLGERGTFVTAMFVAAIFHHLAALLVLDLLYRESVRDRSSVLWYGLAGLVIDAILFRAIRMCLTGRVDWRGTTYAPPSSGDGLASKPS
ncbi:MAG: glycosyltransferase family 2 protein [Isosphaeraceae bacterium]|nr:glycosyltransferase family 2 protein [Isosphaeraceae bacterium]